MRLTDAQMQQFHTEGWLLLPAAAPQGGRRSSL